jgi:hypothetical protein
MPKERMVHASVARKGFHAPSCACKGGWASELTVIRSMCVGEAAWAWHDAPTTRCPFATPGMCCHLSGPGRTHHNWPRLVITGMTSWRCGPLAPHALSQGRHHPHPADERLVRTQLCSRSLGRRQGVVTSYQKKA